MHLPNPASHFDRQVSYPGVSIYVSTNPVMMLLLLMQFWIDRIGVVISALRDSLDCGVFFHVTHHACTLPLPNEVAKAIGDPWFICAMTCYSLERTTYIQ